MATKKTTRTVKTARTAKPTKFDELKTWARKPANRKQARNAGIAALIGGAIGALIAS